MTVTAELTQIIEILESQIPANPLSPQNQKLRGKLERKLAKYFTDLEQAFPYSKIDKIYNSNVKESVTSDIGKVLDPLLATFKTKLTPEMTNELADIYLSGQAEMVTWGKTKAGIPIAYEGPPSKAAIDWATQHGAKLVTQMDSESKRRLSKVISDGIANKRGIPGIQRDLRTTFGDMSKYRSELIARTETANALSTASIDSMNDMGIEGKEWVTAGDDQVSEECQGNESEGVIPVNQAFSGGVMAPPQHPDCRCTVAPALLKK